MVEKTKGTGADSHRKVQPTPTGTKLPGGIGAEISHAPDS
jgi:hypothetical protein